MAKVKTGIHYIPIHGRPEDMNAVEECPAPFTKIVYSSRPDPDHLREVLRRAPEYVIVRDHAKSEQKDDVWRDPEETGTRHAREWREHLEGIPGIDLSRILVEGVNEFPHWAPGGIDAQVRYELAFGMEIVPAAFNSIHCEFPVGWPGNGGIADAPPDWTPWEPVLEFIDAHPKTFLGLHEYWGFNTGVYFYAGWWFLRYRKMPHRVPTILTELGGLKAYQNPDGSWGLLAQNGWMGDISVDEYLSQWQTAELEMRKDSDLEGAVIFTTDGAQPWIGECDAGPVNPSYIEWARQQPELEDDNDQTVYIPVVVTPPEPLTSRKIDPKVAIAIMQVESGGDGYGPDGRLKIRFEAHVFQDRLDNDTAFGRYFRVADDRPWEQPQYYRDEVGNWLPIHTGSQRPEYEAFKLARTMNSKAAYESLGMGLGQIMGFNAQRVGFASARDMFSAFENPEDDSAQVLGYINYVLTDSKLIKAIRSRDWRMIAELYNGTGWVDVYAPRLEEAYKRIPWESV